MWVETQKRIQKTQPVILSVFTVQHHEINLKWQTPNFIKTLSGSSTFAFTQKS
jgi:hypothetical protein